MKLGLSPLRFPRLMPKRARDEMQVYVYRNLHKNLYSVRNEKLGRVTQHAEFVLVKNAALSVGKKGRERVLRERQKNIHAGIRGELIAAGSANIVERFRTDSKDWVAVYYNPYKTETFVERNTGLPVLKAEYVFLGPEGAFIK